jgi:hypothetical protein
MGQGTMTLTEAADVSKTTVEHLAREAYEGRLRLHPLPPCDACGTAEQKPCLPDCAKAGTQVVWVGDWFHWFKGGRGGLGASSS